MFTPTQGKLFARMREELRSDGSSAFVSPAEAALRLGIPERAIEQLGRAGLLVSISLHGQRVVPVSEVSRLRRWL